MANNEVKVVFAGDATALEAASKKSGSALDGVSTSVDKASKSIQGAEPHTKSMADHTDRLATKSSTAYGAVSALGSGFTLLGKNQPFWLMPVALGFDAMSGAMDIATLAQESLNLAWLTSPITWIIIGIVAIVAAIVLIATKTTWFQTIWKAVWGFLKSVGEWFAGPFVHFFVTAGEAIAAPFLWLWHSVIEPVFDGIAKVIEFWWNIVSSVFNLAKWVIENTVGAAIMWLWHDVFEPAFQGIAVVAKWLWDNGIKPVVDYIIGGYEAVGSAAMWLWNNAIKPAFDGVSAVIKWAWENAIKPVFDLITNTVHTIGSTISDVFSKVGGWISNGFGAGVSIIKGMLNSIIDVINGAISGINTLISAVNKVPGVNFPHIPTIPRLHSGGVVPGAPGQEVLAILQAGERVIPANHANNGGGDTYNITVNGGQFANGDSFNTWISSLKNNKRRGLVPA